MRASGELGRAAGHAARALGAASLISGAALLVRPRPLCRLYGLPEVPWLGRALGVRDSFIGVALLAPERRLRALGGACRAISDLCDGALIAREATRGRRAAGPTCGRLLIALASAAGGLLVARFR